MAQLVKNPPARWKTWVPSLDWEDRLEKGKAHPVQYSGLENSMDCMVHGVAESQTRLSDFHFTLWAVNRGTDSKTNIPDFLVVQWLRLHVPSVGGPGLIPGQGTRSRMAATKEAACHS